MKRLVDFVLYVYMLEMVSISENLDFKFQYCEFIIIRGMPIFVDVMIA